MNRSVVSFALSAALHLATFSALSALPREDATPPPVQVIRVTLSKTERPQPAPAPVETKVEPAPAVTEKLEPPPVKKIEPEKPKPQPKPPEKPKPTTQKQPKPAVKPPEEKSEPIREESAAAADTPAPPHVGEPAARAATPSPAAAGIPQPGPSRAPVDVSALKVTKKVNAEYPMISRKRREHGTVILLIEIVSGRAASVKIERSSGHSMLDESAVRAAKQWVFETTGYGNEVVARVPFKFELK
jgi:protein TonB